MPVLAELPRYSVSTGWRDLLAGLTVAGLSVPAAMAYGQLAGLTAANGLYMLILPIVAYALLGSSRQLVVGPEGSIATLVAAAILPIAVAGSEDAIAAAGVLSIVVAACFTVAWLLRLGWVADYFSRPVLIGYIHGVAVVLVVSQLGKLLGVPLEARDPIPQVREVLGELSAVSGQTVLLSLVTLSGLMLARFRASRMPASLIAVVVAIAVSWAFDLSAQDIATVGSVPQGLPEIGLPALSSVQVLELIPAAVGIFLASFADGILTARSFAGKNGQHIRASQEMLAFGVANAAAGISGGFPIGASGSRTTVNDDMRARTQLAGAVAAGAVIIVLLFLTKPIAYLPEAVLGAIIVSAAVGLVDRSAWRSIAPDRIELWIGIATAVGVVLIGVLYALIIAFLLTLFDAVRRSAQPHDAVLGWLESQGRYADVSVHPSATVTPGVVVYRLDDRLFYANARYVEGRVREAIDGADYTVTTLVFDAEATTHVDSSGVAALGHLQAGLDKEGITLVLARVKSPVKVLFDKAGLSSTIGEANFFPTVRAAVDAVA
jgi:high affinity sulfate transporter 1